MDPFATLGFSRRYDLDPQEIERRYRELQKALHPDRHIGLGASQRRVALGKAVEVNEAYRTLRDDQKRAEALLALLAGGQDQKQSQADPALLSEIMALREALGDAKRTRDAAGVRELSARVLAAQEQTRALLARVFAELTGSSAEGALAQAAALVARLKYYERLLEEVRDFEEAD